MSPNLTPVPDLVQRFHQIFDEEAVLQMARDSGFLQRQRKLDVFRFVTALIFGTVGPQRRSYKQLVADIHTAGGATVAAQSLADRMTLEAANLLLMLLRRPLERAEQSSRAPQAGVPAWLEQFPQVWATDSSSMRLPDDLTAAFPGCGGDASVAALKLHLSLEVLKPQLRAFRFTSARVPDMWPAIAEQAPPGTLHLFDKAYGQDRTLLQKIGDLEQFYLTPLWLPLPLFDEQGRRLDIEQLCRAYEKSGQFDQPIFLQDPRGGRCHRQIRARLVGTRIPADVAAERRRRLRQKAKDSGKRVSARTLRLQDWVILLTNVPKRRLSAQQVRASYRLRWQIELMFRRWKHLYGMRAPGYKKVESLYCHLLAALVAAALMTLVHGAMFQQWDPGVEAEPSQEQATALLLRQGPALMMALASDGDGAFRIRLLERILEDIVRLGRMQKRRRVSSRRRILDPELNRTRRPNKLAA